jgi:PhzF family phenazine biosynthesis protein
MTKYPYYEVNAFTTGPFTGNPAGVVLAESWPSDETMQRIAAQNNLAETAFVVRNGDHYGIRWFTPTSEIDLCGHATLGSAFALMEHEGNVFERGPLTFHYGGGTLEVTHTGDLFAMNFPLVKGERFPDTKRFEDALGIRVEEAYLGRDLALVVPSEDAVRAFQPNDDVIRSLPGLGCILTAKSAEYDFVSRAFFPELGIGEDPVTGSAHCFLAWIWGNKMNQTRFHAFQASPRGGELWLSTQNERVILQGRAEGYLRGEITIA